MANKIGSWDLDIGYTDLDFCMQVNIHHMINKNHTRIECAIYCSCVSPKCVKMQENGKF